MYNAKDVNRVMKSSVSPALEEIILQAAGQLSKGGTLLDHDAAANAVIVAILDYLQPGLEPRTVHQLGKPYVNEHFGKDEEGAAVVLLKPRRVA